MNPSLLTLTPRRRQPAESAFGQPLQRNHPGPPNIKGLLESARRDGTDRIKGAQVSERRFLAASIATVAAQYGGVLVTGPFGMGKSSACRLAADAVRAGLILNVREREEGEPSDVALRRLYEMRWPELQEAMKHPELKVLPAHAIIVEGLSDTAAEDDSTQMRTAQFVRSLMRPGRLLIVPGHEDKLTDTLQARLQMPRLVVPPLPVDAYRPLFQDYSDRFGVEFTVDAIADVVTLALTPLQVRQTVEAAAKLLLERTDARGCVDGALMGQAMGCADYELPTQTFVMDLELLACLLLAAVIPRDRRQLAALERYAEYGLVARVGNGTYNLTDNLFTRGLAGALDADVYASARALIGTDPARAAGMIVMNLLDSLAPSGPE